MSDPRQPMQGYVLVQGCRYYTLQLFWLTEYLNIASVEDYCTFFKNVMLKVENAKLVECSDPIKINTTVTLVCSFCATINRN